VRTLDLTTELRTYSWDEMARRFLEAISS
jgi:hypothetical protein